MFDFDLETPMLLLAPQESGGGVLIPRTTALAGRAAQAQGKQPEGQRCQCKDEPAEMLCSCSFMNNGLNGKLVRRKRSHFIAIPRMDGDVLTTAILPYTPGSASITDHPSFDLGSMIIKKDASRSLDELHEIGGVPGQLQNFPQSTPPQHGQFQHRQSLADPQIDQDARKYQQVFQFPGTDFAYTYSTVGMPLQGDTTSNGVEQFSFLGQSLPQMSYRTVVNNMPTAQDDTSSRRESYDQYIHPQAYKTSHFHGGTASSADSRGDKEMPKRIQPTFQPFLPSHAPSRQSLPFPSRNQKFRFGDQNFRSSVIEIPAPAPTGDTRPRQHFIHSASSAPGEKMFPRINLPVQVEIFEPENTRGGGLRGEKYFILQEPLSEAQLPDIDFSTDFRGTSRRKAWITHKAASSTFEKKSFPDDSSMLGLLCKAFL
ncbi:unnamed protein product [Cyprideis torosa]|uniref:Uncharacterized protein n=1 Tax=Cyprideis torosa TaxID=163714 RepID=A0A7R8WCG2_9CRUS|nr:unnamed protein product [Cyprideis torosa]CAG0888379.1 unnamed protein product [Cyprideis torosa]